MDSDVVIWYAQLFADNVSNLTFFSSYLRAICIRYLMSTPFVGTRSKGWWRPWHRGCTWLWGRAPRPWTCHGASALKCYPWLGRRLYNLVLSKDKVSSKNSVVCSRTHCGSLNWRESPSVEDVAIEQKFIRSWISATRSGCQGVGKDRRDDGSWGNNRARNIVTCTEHSSFRNVNFMCATFA